MLPIPDCGGADDRQVFVYVVVTSGSVGGDRRVSIVGWLHGGTQRRDLAQQRGGPDDLGAESLHPSSQLCVGGVDQRGRPMRAFVQELHDSIVGSIAAAMPGVNHDEALGRRRHAGWLLPIEHDRPYASVAEGQRDDLGDEPSSGPGPIAPPAVRPRAHDIVAVDEDCGLRRPGHAALRSPSCRRGCPETERGPLLCQGAMILGAWGRDTVAMRIPGSD